MVLRKLSFLLSGIVFLAMTAMASAATITVTSWAIASFGLGDLCGPDAGPSCSSTSTNTIEGSFGEGASATSSAMADIVTGELKAITSATYGLDSADGTGSGYARARITETGITAVGSGVVTAFLNVDFTWDLFSLSSTSVSHTIQAHIYKDGTQQAGGLFLSPVTTDSGSLNQLIQATFNVNDGDVFDLAFRILVQLLHGEGSIDGFSTGTIFITTSENLTLNFADADFLSNPAFDPTVIPLPAAFPLFATALAGMGLLGWRRKRKPLALV